MRVKIFNFWTQMSEKDLSVLGDAEILCTISIKMLGIHHRIFLLWENKREQRKGLSQRKISLEQNHLLSYTNQNSIIKNNMWLIL